MFPEPLRLGPLALSYYGLMVALGVLAALALFSWTAPKRNLTPGQARDVCFWMVLAGLLGSRAFFVIFHWPHFAHDWTEIFAYWRGGLMFQGGLIAAVLISPLVLKLYGLDFWNTADVMAPSLALGQAFGRLGCFAAGCCYGRPVGPDQPLGVVFPPGSLAPSGMALWPTQLLEAGGLLGLALILVFSLRLAAFSRPGRLAGLYLLGAGLMRTVMDQLRGDFRGEPVVAGLAPTTLAALAAAALGLVLLIRRRPHF